MQKIIVLIFLALSSSFLMANEVVGYGNCPEGEEEVFKTLDKSEAIFTKRVMALRSNGVTMTKDFAKKEWESAVREAFSECKNEEYVNTMLNLSLMIFDNP